MQNYVILKNLRKAPAAFGTHLNNYVTLEPFGKQGDTLKVLLSDDKELAGQIRHYTALGKTGEMQVIFSDGAAAAKVPAAPSRSTVTSTAEVEQRTANLLSKLRSEQAVKARGDKTNDARLIRAKAEAMIKGTGVVLVKQDAKAVRAAAEAAANAAKAVTTPVRAPVSGDEGVEMTAESLKTVGKVGLYEIAEKMGIKARPGTSERGLIKAILLAAK